MESNIGIITEIMTLATHDGPGIRTTVFTKGCPLRCCWCANPECFEKKIQLFFIPGKCRECETCIGICPEQIISMIKERKIDRRRCTICLECVKSCNYDALKQVGKKISAKDLVEKIALDLPFFVRSGGGLTLSGGEPLFQPDFTSEVFERCHRKGIHTVLDTCGYASKEDVRKVIKHTDLVLLDLKHMNPEMHKKFTGVSCEPILENARYIAGKCDMRISLPLIPDINDSEENLRLTLEFVSSIGVEFIDLEPYHELGICKYEFLDLKPPILNASQVVNEKVEEIMEMVRSYGLKVTKGRLF